MWFSGFRAVIYVDNHPVEKAIFSNQADAQTWCIDKQIELSAVVRA
jgi:hypothetical protein